MGRIALAEGASSARAGSDQPSNALAALHRLRSVDNITTDQEAIASPPAYPPLPRTPRSRLSQPDAYPTPFPTGPSRSSGLDSESDTVLYLAYGSNLAAQVFQGVRKVKPLSAIPVSAPSLRLTFDLPGLPYREPCFANAALRKVPKPPVPVPTPDPPNIPPEVPDLPDPPVWPPRRQSSLSSTSSGLTDYDGDGVERDAAGDPVWTKGMIGVVYEVTREDFANIIKTEGGGASYHDVVIPCIPLPPSMHVPEKPPVPELPRPFLAHTLFAPRLPDDPREPGAIDGDGDGDGDDGDEPEPPRPTLPPWARRLILPVRRSDPDYAQASARYLGLLAQGAKEHDLPEDYQAYLNALRPYTPTTRRQRIGFFVFAAFWGPVIMSIFILQRLHGDKETGRAPPWLAAASNVVFNLSWLSYDCVAKPLFGDGERTEAEESASLGRIRLEGSGDNPAHKWGRRESIVDEENKGSNSRQTVRN